MGKKIDVSKKRKRNIDNDDNLADINEIVEADLQAEIEAVMAIRAEKESQIIPQPLSEHSYNKEGLLRAVETVGIESLPFIETLHVDQYDLYVEDENDDLEREVVIYTVYIIYWI